MKNRTIISLDFGKKIIGVAIGQEITYTAHTLTSLKVNKKYLKNIEKILNAWNPELVLVGLPLNMDGTEQPITDRARNFAHCIQKYFDVKITLHDERLSTVEARSYLFDIGGFRALDKCSIDSTAALIILESWFYGER